MVKLHFWISQRCNFLCCMINKNSKDLMSLEFLAERMGFEPMCDCSQTDFESFQPLWLLWFFCIAFRLFCPPETIAVSRCFGIHPWKKLDFSRGSNESQKWADFGSFVRIRVRNVRTMLEQHSIHRRLPPNKWQRCMLWKSMTLIGRKCRIFLLRNRCACFAIAANEQRSIIWKAESCRAFIRGRKPGATKSGKKIWWLS